MNGDPLLTEIEIQLKLAQQALNNVVAFVARVNTASEPHRPNDDDDELLPSYESTPVDVLPAFTHHPTEAANGQRKQKRR